MKRRMTAALLAAATALSLGSCGGGIVRSEDEFQKAMHQSSTSRLDAICEAEDGYYFSLETLKGPFLYFLDKETKAATILCGKPECPHTDDTCDAYLRVYELWTTGGRLYYTHYDYEERRDGVADLGLRLHSVGTDGKSRKVVQSLELVPGGDTSQRTARPILHRGQIYFPYSGVLYRAPLGGDTAKDAVAIWGSEIESSGGVEIGGMTVAAGDLNALGYALWADGDLVYFMVNLPQPGGTCRDTLFSYDTVSEEVRQVWEVPGPDEVGRWGEEGVSVDQWYILDGFIYFFLSQNGLWRQSLAGGAPEKLGDVARDVPYGTGIFSDEYFCLMNDVPDPSYGNAVLTFGTGPSLVYGDAIYVYDLTGAPVAALDISALYDELQGLTHCMPVFCDGEDVYFVAETCTVTGGPVTEGIWTTPAQKTYTRYLYRAGIGTGELAQILSWT